MNVTSDPATLQERLEKADDQARPQGRQGDGEDLVSDPVGLLLDFEESGRFHRDRGLGRIYHLGGVSFRENQPTDSLHVSVHGNRLAAHVDRVSPLGPQGQRRRYSFRRAVAHNVGGMAHDFVRLLRGRQGDHRSELNCEWLWDRSQLPDESHLLDATAAAWSVQLEARLAGRLDAERLRAAMEAAFSGQSLGKDPLEVADCPDDTSLDAARTRLQRAVVRADEWPPLRACLARQPQGDVLMLNLNHAAADGPGALRVLDCIARAYASGRAPDPPLDFLSVRDLPVRPASAPVSFIKRAYKASVERLRDGLARPAQLAIDEPGEGKGYGFHLVTLSVEDTRRVINVERAGTSRNILMAGLHLAIGDWNLRYGAPGRQISVLVPVNLRPPEWPEENIGNFSVTARVSTSRRHRSGPTAALKAVTAQTTRNKRTRSGVALIGGLERAGLLPLWAKQSLVVLQPLTRNRLVDTAMLAHLGWLEEAPSFGPDAGETVELWFSVPARAPQALCVGTVTVAGRLHLTFRYPRRLFSPDAIGRFARSYVDTICGVADSRRGAQNVEERVRVPSAGRTA